MSTSITPYREPGTLVDQEKILIKKTGLIPFIPLSPPHKSMSMENPNTWTLLHYDLARASRQVFTSTEQKAEVLAQVLLNHKLEASQDEVLAVILSYAQSIEEGRCGLSLQSTIVNAFQK